MEQPVLEYINVCFAPLSLSVFVAVMVLTWFSGLFLTGGIMLDASYFASSSKLGGQADIFVVVITLPLYVGAVAMGIPGVILLVNNVQSKASIAEADHIAWKPSPLAPHAATFGVPIISKSF
jgi:hypothetical protein